MAYPTTLDSLQRPAAGAPMTNPSHVAVHGELATAIEALEAKVGVTDSVVTTTHDYRIAQLEESSGTGMSVVTKTGDYAATPTDGLILCNAAGGAFTVTLPPAEDCVLGKQICVKKIDSSDNFVTVDGDGSQPLDDASQKIIPVQNQFNWFITDRVQWYVV